MGRRPCSRTVMVVDRQDAAEREDRVGGRAQVEPAASGQSALPRLLATSTWPVSQARARNCTRVDASRRDATELAHDMVGYPKECTSIRLYPYSFKDVVRYWYNKQVMHSAEELEVVHPVVFVQTV